MRTRTTLRSVVALGCAAVLVLGGCGSGGENDSGTNPDTARDESPLAEYLGEGGTQAPAVAVGAGDFAVVTGWGGGRSALFLRRKTTSGDDRARQRKVEQIIADCMRDKGFEYVPYIPSEEPESPVDEAYDLPPEKFAEQYGYGISTMFDQESKKDAPTSPNDEIRSGLSQQAKAAYDEALYGSAVAVDPESGGAVAEARPLDGDETAPEDLGCMPAAHEKVYGSSRDSVRQLLAERQKFDGLFKDLDALEKRIQRDPDLAKAHQDWAACMADAEHPGLARPDDAVNAVNGKMSKVFTDEGTDESKLAEVQKFEMAISAADFACRAKGLTEVEKKVRTEHERAFVDDHRNELIRYRDWRTQAEKAGR
ncbi:MAG TPA: hypothetical protein VI076_06210 [Actinopolymorphaceae bacterium]